LYVKAAKTDNDIERKLLADHAKKSDSNYKYEAMLNLAKCEVPILPEEMDMDMMLLNVNNGTIDLRMGKLREHRRDDFITKQSSVDYVSGASCERWLSFLGRIMNNNTNLIEFLQRAIGYALTGDIGEQTLFFLYGTGANGKTVFLESIKGMLGDYAKEAEPEILIQKRNDSHPTGVADLMGARFVSTTEVGEGRRMDEVKVKQLTGGDRLKARFMRQDFFEFYPTHKIFLAANHKPIIRGTDLAIWRRIRLVPFEVTIPEQERIPLAKMLAQLASEWSGILAWAVQGCLAWQEHGLGVPLEVEKATQAYRDEMDVLTNFFDECCVIHENAWVNSAKLWNAYLAWTKENEEQYPLGRRAFGNRLTARGFISEQAKIVGKNQRIWRGVGLAVEPDTKYEEGVI
jgi:putative DNA primase/helicase